jgi:cytidylate kinase
MHVINIFITADETDRIKRIRERHPELTEEQTRTFMQKADSKRASYYNYYSDFTWGHASTYHLCLNSSTLGIEGTMQFIKAFVEAKLK